LTLEEVLDLPPERLAISLGKKYSYLNFAKPLGRKNSNAFITQDIPKIIKEVKMVFKKIPSGVPGMDEILKGGIRENASVLLSGGPGTGKSIIGMQFLLEGARKKEKGLCILYDTKEEDFLNYAEELGLDLKKYVRSKMIEIVQQPIIIKKVASLDTPIDLLKGKEVKRVVLDSLSMFSYIHVTEDRDYRKKIIDFLGRMRDVTLLATVEASGDNLDELDFKPEEFLFDGVIRLTKVRQEAIFERVVHVSKMRGQDHEIKLCPFSIGKGGIEIYPYQYPFAILDKDKENKGRK
jgi:KaiC/GvpD/RAD55 family RecA-like ATPase